MVKVPLVQLSHQKCSGPTFTPLVLNRELWEHRIKGFYRGICPRTSKSLNLSTFDCFAYF